MKLIGVADSGPSVVRLLFDCRRVQASQVAGVLRQRPSKRHIPRPPLLQGGVVQECVGHSVQYLVGEYRRLHRVPAVDLYLTGLYRRQYLLVAFQVHGLGQAIADCLEYQGVVGRFNDVGDRVVLALDLSGKDGGQQVVGPHALQWRGDPASPGVPQQGQETGGVPPPPGAEQRGLEHGLEQHLFHGAGRQVGENIRYREGQGRPQREVETVIGGGRLQFKVEGPADAFPEGHSPSTVYGRAEGGVDDQLHSAAFIEEPLRDHPAGSGDHTQNPFPFQNVGCYLAGNLVGDTGFGSEPRGRLGWTVQPLVQLIPDPADFLGQLPSPARGLAQPERYIG